MNNRLLVEAPYCSTPPGPGGWWGHRALGARARAREAAVPPRGLVLGAVGAGGGGPQRPEVQLRHGGGGGALWGGGCWGDVEGMLRGC